MRPKARRPLRGRFWWGPGAGTSVEGDAREEKLGRVRRKLTVVTGLTQRSLTVKFVGLASQLKVWWTVCR